MNNTQHINVEDPIYMKHADLQYVSGDIPILICQAADRIQSACAIGAQKHRGVWILFVNKESAKERILDAGITI